MIDGDMSTVSTETTTTAQIDTIRVCDVQIVTNIVNFSIVYDVLIAAILQKHKYESGATIDKKSWGFRRDTDFSNDFLMIENLVWQLVSTVR